MSAFSIKSIVASASQQLCESSDSAKLDAQVLLGFVLNQSTSYLLTWPDKNISTVQLEHFNKLLSRRLAGEPIAYIVGEREFWSLPFDVSPSTLIPRPDTEILVELVLTHFTEQHINLLDLGTGTGAIALALASEQKTWNITAIDFNLDAVELAKRNAKKLALTHVDIFQSNWFSNINKNTKLDVIVSNPPYIDPLDKHLNEGDVRFEPKSALTAADNGLADIWLIIDQSKSFLHDGGRVYIEHGYDQGDKVRACFLANGYKNAETVKDLASNDRITWAIFDSNNNNS